MGPFVRIGFGRGRERTPGSDEAAAMRVAFEVAARDIASLSARSGAGAAECLEFQLALLEDDSLTERAFGRIADGCAADFAWNEIANELIRDYEADPSAYVRARCLDVVDLRDRVLGDLNGELRTASPPRGAIVAAEDLPPSRFLEIDWSAGGGIVLSRGSEMSHTAILARARGVPMIVQTGDLSDAKMALVDADRGFVELDPSDGAKRGFAPRPRANTAFDLGLQANYRGERIRLLLNIEGPESLLHPSAPFADGVGLMRTEFLFLGRNETPDEQAQFDAYCAVLHWAGDRPVTIRTVDAGGDKAIKGLSEEREANPFLGLRGLRLSLRRPEAFATQLRALGRAAARGHLKVMFPMVTTPSEFEIAKSLFVQIVETLKAEGREARLPELGMMVEVPAAAMTVADFHAAFYSIGANDLTQFVMASDRGNGAVSHLYDPMSPAVLELVRRVVEHGRTHGRNVSLCGDVAGDPARTIALMECGLRELSMSAGALGAVKRVLSEHAEAALD